MSDIPAGADRSAEPAALFGSLARIVYASDDYAAVYQAVVDAAPQLVLGCDHASLMLRSRGAFVTAAASDDTARLVDQLERELRQGPCTDAIVDEAAHVDADLRDGSPWPQLSAEVQEQTSVRAMAGFRLIVDNQKAGALNVFGDTPGALTRDSVDQAAVLAAFVSVALMASSRGELASTLRGGMESNREIGKAIGLMMAFHKVSDEEAFSILKRASQEMNIKLAEVARRVVQHHNARPPS